MDKHRHFIFLVDDDPDDRAIIKEALGQTGSEHEITEASDGEQAIKLLQDMKATYNLPCLMVVDINMPRVNGKELVVAIQADERLSSIPLVVLTTSNSLLDKLFFAKKGVEMIEKPIELKSIVSVAFKLIDYCKNEQGEK